MNRKNNLKKKINKTFLFGVGVAFAIGITNHGFAQTDIQMLDGQREEIQNVSNMHKIPDAVSRYDMEQVAEIERQIEEQKALEEQKILETQQVNTVGNVDFSNSEYIDVEITYYTAAADEGSGTGITASGTVATAGRTIACNFLPIGTKVEIDGQVMIVEDRGGMGGNVIDVFVNSKAEAFALGRQYKTVRVIR
jgi:3D (Asp-Asp-Asp) domain-containing protein